VPVFLGARRKLEKAFAMGSWVEVETVWVSTFFVRPGYWQPGRVKLMLNLEDKG